MNPFLSDIFLALLRSLDEEVVLASFADAFCKHSEIGGEAARSWKKMGLHLFTLRNIHRKDCINTAIIASSKEGLFELSDVYRAELIKE